MPSASRYVPILILTASSAAGYVFAQDIQGDPWRPVDQTVGDLDPNAVSTRRVEQGISVYGQSGSLYHRSDLSAGYNGLGRPLTQQYQLRQPGFTAWLDQPDYLVSDPHGEIKVNISPVHGGGAIGLIPPNTVFDLVPQTQTVIPYAAYDDGWDLSRVNTRYYGVISGVVTGNPEAQELPPPPRAHRLPEHLIAARKARAAAALEQPVEETEIAAEQQTDAEASTDDAAHETATAQ